MAASKLKTLKIRVDHLLIGAGAVVLTVAVLLVWRARQPAQEQAGLEQELEQLRGKQTPARRAPPRFVRDYHASARPEEIGEGVAIPQLPAHADPGDLTSDQAIDEFKQVLGELEAIVESGRKLSAREEAEYYNRATGSFTALSSWVDPNDPGERALMDDAYLQMKSLMHELQLEPPPVDPDYNPLRR